MRLAYDLRAPGVLLLSGVCLLMTERVRTGDWVEAGREILMLMLGQARMPGPVRVRGLPLSTFRPVSLALSTAAANWFIRGRDA